MAIAPRCCTSGSSAASTASSFSPALTAWTNADGPSGTAPASGDIVLIVGTISTNALSGVVSQTAGAGTWTFQGNDDANGGASPGMTTWLAWRIFDG